MDSIVVESLSKCYTVGDRKMGGRGRPPMQIWALKDVSFAARAGEVLGIIGRNGAGKTTLLKVLGQITSPTSGRAVLNGRVVSLLEMGIGFQPDLSARENIFLNAAVYGVSPREVQRHFDQIIAFAELEKFVDAPVLRHYSSGMYLRLAFSVAVNMNPDILLADEVLAVGDIGFQERCMTRMREIGKQGATVLFVSHDMNAVERLCDRCLRLEQGSVADDAPPSEAVAGYQKALLNMTRKTGITESQDPARAEGEIISVEITDMEGGKLGAVKASADFVIEIAFRMFKDNVPVCCGFDLKAGSVTVFRSMQPEDFVPAANEACKATCRVPAYLLADIAYTVTAFAAFRDARGEGRKIASHDALSFQVYDTEEVEASRRIYAERRSPRVIAPRLEWGKIWAIKQ